MIVEVFIENDKLDLFGDENIQITSAVADITDITKNVTDYSRSFTVPSSSTNNRIFKSYYNANIDNTFDARVKANSSIYLNGVLFRQGKAQLNKVEIKKGKPSSYSLTFFGNLLNLSKLVGNDKLVDLDLSAFEHPFIGSEIKTGLETGLFGGDVVYSLFMKRQAFYSSDPSDSTDLDNLVNIAYQGGSNQNGVQFNELRASIKNIRIIEAIESKYGLTFSRNFFGRSEFTETYILANRNSDLTTGGGAARVIFDGGDLTYYDAINNSFLFTTSIFPNPPQTFFYVFLYFTVTPESGFENVPYTIKYYRNGNLIDNIFYPNGGVQNRTNTLTDPKDYEVYYEISSELEFSFTTNLRQLGFGTLGSSVELDINSTSSIQTIGSNFDFSLELPDIKIIDYLKAFFQMFKLVILPTGENSLYVNTIQDYYKEGESFDITKYVDQENYSVERGELLNEINYTFEEPTTILNIEFERQTNQFYGNEESFVRVDQNDSNSELIDGKKEDFKIPFEVIIYDRLIDQNDDLQTNVMYAPVIDKERNPASPKTHIHYNINQDISIKPIGLIDELDNKLEISRLNTPFHCEKIDEPQFSLLFSQELNEWDGATMTNTLFSNHHARYIAGIFNVKRRNYKYKAKLPFKILTKITLDDILKISENFYRIDNFTTNLTTGQVDLELITAFDVNINRVEADRTNILVDFNAQTTSVFVTNLNNPTLTKVDLGNGTGWLTLSINSGSIFFAFDSNPNAFQRVMQVDLVQGIFTINFFVTQTGTGIVTADNTSITVDNTLITVDNG